MDLYLEILDNKQCFRTLDQTIWKVWETAIFKELMPSKLNPRSSLNHEKPKPQTPKPSELQDLYYQNNKFSEDLCLGNSNTATIIGWILIAQFWEFSNRAHNTGYHYEYYRIYNKLYLSPDI